MEDEDKQQKAFYLQEKLSRDFLFPENHKYWTIDKKIREGLSDDFKEAIFLLENLNSEQAIKLQHKMIDGVKKNGR